MINSMGAIACTMSLVKLLKDYIRGFDYDANPGMAPGYTFKSLSMESGMNRDLSVIVRLLFFAIFWLGMENYVTIVSNIIDVCRQRRYN
jgi:hypothetical protein